MLEGNFFQPWVEIDPALKHGGIPGELEDQFVGPKLGDNYQTANIDMFHIFYSTNENAAALSMHPEGDKEGPPTKGVVQEVLRAVNVYMELIWDRTNSSSVAMFYWTHATPPFLQFKMRPIRYPLRSEFLHIVTYHFLGTQVEIAEMNSNGGHANLDPSSSSRLIAPILHLKSNIIKDYFDLEVAGEISTMEIAEMFAGKQKPGPNIVPPDESHPLPDENILTQALSGVDLIQWYPGEAEWQIFGKKRDEKYKPERIWQPEGTRRTTEDVAPEQPTGANPPGFTPG